MNQNPWEQPFNGYLHEVALRIVKAEHTSTDIKMILQFSDAMALILPSVREHQKWANTIVDVRMKDEKKKSNKS